MGDILKKTVKILSIFVIYVAIIKILKINSFYNENKKSPCFKESSSNEEYYISNDENNELLLTLEEIEKYNYKLKSNSNKIYDLNIKVLSKKEVTNYINSYTMPSMPKYNSGILVTSKDISQILENRNLEAIDDNVYLKKGIVVNRTNLKSFPTNIHFFNNLNDKNFDSLQESEIHVNTPVLIMNVSKDEKWLFVLTNNYIGWVNKDDIVYVDDEEFDYFTKNNSFVVITEPFLEINDILLDMSVELPYIKSTKDGYEVSLPVKGKSGKLIKKKVVIPKKYAHIGYLPYTKKNIYIQVFKYENVPYSWGGMDYGIDCSGYVSNVYHTFGFKFPRNTSDQSASLFKKISLLNKTNEEKLNIIGNNYLALLYKKGHVVIYLGKRDNKYYVISASGSLMKVAVEQLNDLNYLNDIYSMVIVY